MAGRLTDSGRAIRRVWSWLSDRVHSVPSSWVQRGSRGKPAQSVETAHGESEHIGGFLLRHPRLTTPTGGQILTSLSFALLSLVFFLPWNRLNPYTAEDNRYFLFYESKWGSSEQGFLEITPVAEGKYLLCNCVSDDPTEFWDLEIGSHFIFTNMGGRSREADVQKTSELWKRLVRVLYMEMFLWVVLFFSSERGDTTWECVFISFFNGST